jgi:hypothetical protein
MIEPALVLFGQGAGRDVATDYNLQKPSIRPTGRDDGSLILAFDPVQSTLDGPTLRLVIDPCAHRVLHVDERQDNALYFLFADAFRTDDATLQSALVGSWIVPPDAWIIKPDDPGAQPDINLRIVQSFRADGGGLTQVYKDGACTLPDRSVAFTWSVRDSVLTLQPAKSDSDAFLLESPHRVGIALDEKPDRMAIFAPDQKSYGLLNRAPHCGWPDNLQLRNY